MKLKTFVEGIESNDVKLTSQVLVAIMYETMKEGMLKESLTANCVMSGGMNGIEDTIGTRELQAIMDRVANGNSDFWLKVVKKSECMKSMISKLNGTPCDVTIDNPGVKKVVTDKVQGLWMKLQTAGAQNATAGVKGVFDAMKKVFAIEYKSMINAPAVASA